jgi:hypothetical protein
MQHDSKSYCLAQAEKQRKLAVWARRARKPYAAAKHENDYTYWINKAESAQ